MKEELNLEGCQNLCAAVVERAAKDYRKALRVLMKNPKNEDAKATAKECELFFGKYAEEWTNISGEKIIKAIQKRVWGEEGVKKRGRRNAGKSGAKKRV